MRSIHVSNETIKKLIENVYLSYYFPQEVAKKTKLTNYTAAPSTCNQNIFSLKMLMTLRMLIFLSFVLSTTIIFTYHN